MSALRYSLLLATSIVCLLASVNSLAGERVRVAVASNFLETAEALVEAFETDSGIRVDLSAGSSGRLYAQIVNGAPFDVFLSADAERPRRLVSVGAAEASSRFTYAVGRLLLYSSKHADCRSALAAPSNGRVAIANPDIAPYGQAARDFLDAAGLWSAIERRLVIGENVSQALQFATLGGAEFGFVAAAQQHKLPDSGCRVLLPAGEHRPIEQQAVLLARAAHSQAARRFLDYLRDDAGALIESFGYGRDDD